MFNHLWAGVHLMNLICDFSGIFVTPGIWQRPMNGKWLTLFLSYGFDDVCPHNVSLRVLVLPAFLLSWILSFHFRTKQSHIVQYSTVSLDRRLLSGIFFFFKEDNGDISNIHSTWPGVIVFFSVIFKDDAQCVNMAHNWGLITVLRRVCCILEEVLNEHLSGNASERTTVDLEESFDSCSRSSLLPRCSHKHFYHQVIRP